MNGMEGGETTWMRPPNTALQTGTDSGIVLTVNADRNHGLCWNHNHSTRLCCCLGHFVSCGLSQFLYHAHHQSVTELRRDLSSSNFFSARDYYTRPWDGGVSRHWFLVEDEGYQRQLSFVFLSNFSPWCWWFWFTRHSFHLVSLPMGMNQCAFLVNTSGSDSAVKQILLVMNEKNAFIIEDLDDYHLVIKADEEYRVRSELETEVWKYIFVPPRLLQSYMHMSLIQLEKNTYSLEWCAFHNNARFRRTYSPRRSETELGVVHRPMHINGTWYT